jgi:hypothetical protein
LVGWLVVWLFGCLVGCNTGWVGWLVWFLKKVYKKFVNSYLARMCWLMGQAHYRFGWLGGWLQ